MIFLTFDRRHPRRKHLGRGQALVETAFGLIVILMLLSGTIDLGRAYIIYTALEDGAGEAALYMSINPGCTKSTDDPIPLATVQGECDDPNNALFRAIHSGGGFVDWSTARVTFKCYDAYNPTTVLGSCYPEEFDTGGTYDGTEVGDIVEAYIEYDFLMLMPLLPSIAGVKPVIQIGSHATEVIVQAQ